MSIFLQVLVLTTATRGLKSLVIPGRYIFLSRKDFSFFFFCLSIKGALLNSANRFYIKILHSVFKKQ